MHHKLASVLNALGIGMGVCMLLALSGLARGTLFEVSDRAESIDAELMVFPKGSGEGVVTLLGMGIWESWGPKISEKHADLVQRAVPVFIWEVKLGGQNQRVIGVDPKVWHTLTGGRELSGGRMFDPDNRFADWLEKELLGESTDDGSAEELDLSKAPPGGFELVIDDRLARVGKYKIGQKVVLGDHTFTIVGTVPAGVFTRVFMPRRTAQYVFADSIQLCTIMFVKLKPGCDIEAAREKIAETTGQDVMAVAEYRAMLEKKFSLMLGYIDIVNGMALLIAFLFIMVTLYTMVLQRNRDIAILKSSGASWWCITRQVMSESALLTMGGTVLGVALAFGAGALIQHFKPLYTVTITPKWILIAFGSAAIGATLSSIYPAWRAARIDTAEVLAQD